jgi:glucose-1-phosphate adenylyltransferase
VPPIGIGPGSIIDGAIVDKNCRIGPGVQIINHQHVQDGDAGQYCQFRDGILVVEKEATLPGDWHA